MRHNGIGILTLGVVVLFSASGVMAEQSHGKFVSASDVTAAPVTGVSPSPIGSPSTTSAKGKLDKDKLKSCEAHEAAITKRSMQMQARAIKTETKFTGIVLKIDTYYTGKLVPAGKTIPNYLALKADIDAKKIAVDSAITASKTDVAQFKCANDDPKASLAAIRVDMKNVNVSLMEYRNSIKTFSRAVRKAAGGDVAATVSPSASASPRPTATIKPELVK